VTKVRELRDIEDNDLLERLESSKEELFNLRFQLATGQLDNPMRIKQVRHEIAQILTILRERELEHAAEAPGDGEAVEEVAETATRRRRFGRRGAADQEGEAS
jgi:large subunit ribosomal protein L29